MLIRFSVSRLFAAILKFCTTREHGPSRSYDAKLAKKTNVRHLEMQIYDHSPRVIVMDIRAFLSSNKTTKGLKRANDDSAGGSTSTCKSSSKRKFVRTWLKDFPWLTYDVEASQMFCKLCRDNTTCSDSSSTFVSGSQNFKIESVRRHESSTGHTHCVAAAKVAENPQLAPLP